MALLLYPLFLFCLLRSLVVGQTSPPTLTSVDPNLLGCQWTDALIAYCGVSTPGFSRIREFQTSASCLCYGGGGWAPNIWDNYQRSCWSHSSTINSGSSISPLTSAPCVSLGNIRNYTRTYTESTFTVSPITATGYLSCMSAEMIGSSCERSTTSFQDLSISEQASCYCYSGQAWKPSFYDDLVGPCLAYQSTASPAAVASIVQELGTPVTAPCASVGDVRLHLPTPASGGAGRAPIPSSTTVGVSSGERAAVPVRSWLKYVGSILIFPRILARLTMQRELCLQFY